MPVLSRSNLNLKVLVSEEMGKTEYPEKNLSEQEGEPKQTQPTCNTDDRIWTWATLVGSQFPHHCPTLAPYNETSFSKPSLLAILIPSVFECGLFATEHDPDHSRPQRGVEPAAWSQCIEAHQLSNGHHVECVLQCASCTLRVTQLTEAAHAGLNNSAVWWPSGRVTGWSSDNQSY